MQPLQALSDLRATATASRVGGRAARRLAEVHAAFSTDMGWIDARLSELVREGTAPATDSARHLLEAGGKRIRPLCVLLSASCFGKVSQAARELAVVAELVHLATLLHDDVIDDGTERRGRPASRTLWGNAVSVLAGDLLLTHALERTSAAAPPEVLADLFATLRRLVDGEVVQLRGRTKLDLREETYLAIVQDKTASLFAWAGRAGASVAGGAVEHVRALGAFGHHLGLAFQLVDDTLDYTGDPAETGKALYADLREGKLTLPLLLAIARDPALEARLHATRAGDESAARHLGDAVRAQGVCEEVRARAVRETHSALQALGVVPAVAARELLACIATELASRAA